MFQEELEKSLLMQSLKYRFEMASTLQCIGRCHCGLQKEQNGRYYLERFIHYIEVDIT